MLVDIILGTYMFYPLVLYDVGVSPFYYATVKRPTSSPFTHLYMCITTGVFWSQIPNTCNTHIGEPRLRTIKNKTNLLKYFRRPSCLCSNKDSKGKHYFAHIFDTVEYTTSKLILRLESMPMSITTNFRLNTPNRSQNTVPHLNTDHITFTAKKQILIIFRPYLRNGLSD